jgi:PAS domain S-box-containing protein
MRIEAELLEEQTRNKLTLELLKEGVIITDSSLKVTHMNPVAESLTGWPTFEAEGHNIEEIIRLTRTLRHTWENRDSRKSYYPSIAKFTIGKQS